jgi:PhoPQ-activated pathogenicity-related protein
MYLFIGFISIVSAIKPLDEYVSKEEPDYGWYFIEDYTFKSLWGGTGYVLNVTSQRWIDESKVKSPTGSLWTHQVIINVPKNLKFKNVSMALMTGGCNTVENWKPEPYSDEDILVVDEIAHNSEAIAITIKHVPNCPMLFANDPL